MQNKPVIFGLVTARGGSKSIPKKNIKEICGKPLIAWTIESAKKSKYLDRVICSTDNEEIAAVAKQFGAEVSFLRPVEFAQDATPDLPVFEHALRWFLENEKILPDIIVHLRPTGPLRTTEDIDAAIELLLSHPEADSIRCVAKAPLHPLKTYRLDEKNYLQPFVPESVYGIPEAYNKPRQQLPKAYASLGYLSVIWSKTILELHSMCGTKILGLEVPEENAIDIDSPIDFIVAEAALSRRLKGI